MLANKGHLTYLTAFQVACLGYKTCIGHNSSRVVAKELVVKVKVILAPFLTVVVDPSRECSLQRTTQTQNWKF